MGGEYNMLLHKGTVKRVLCVLMACVLMLAPVTPASAATARATTMKLEKKVGAVTLKTQSGTSLRITDGMRLYNGNSLATGKYSYAYISLDSSKAVKLDQSSSATLRQNGRSLELLLKSGKLFFNVDKPLGQDERMNVRTSTMVTGIRGTCGVVEAVSQRQSKLYLIEGEVTLGTGDQAVAVRGGQIATVEMGSGSGTPAKPGDADPDAKQAVQVGKMTETDIPSIAFEEIMNDSALQKKIEQTTELDMEKIREAYEQFKKEEIERNNPGKTDQEQKDNRKEDTKKDDNTSGSSSGGSSSGGSSGGSSTPGQPVEKEVVQILNRYLTLTSSCIFDNKGTLDKFVGDCTMAFWGAPMPQEDSIYKAVKTAFDMLERSADVQRELQEKFGRTVSFGIGVHYGPAVVGNIGAPERMDYTAIGDTVNTAARLEANAPGGCIYVSHAVAEALEGRVRCTSLGDSVPLKGKATGFEVLRAEELL